MEYGRLQWISLVGNLNWEIIASSSHHLIKWVTSKANKSSFLAQSQTHKLHCRKEKVEHETYGEFRNGKGWRATEKKELETIYVKS